MANWITLFEKYRIDRRLLKLHLQELSALSEKSPRRAVLQKEIEQIKSDLHGAECILARYGDTADSARDALRQADERLFLAFHYVRGFTMERTAEEMCISRDSIYRIRRRVISRGEIPEEYLNEAGITSLHAFHDDDFPIEPRRNVLQACFAGAPKGVTDSLLSACP
jgi:hypothetical protein